MTMALFWLCFFVSLVGIQPQKMTPMIPVYPALVNLTRTNLCPQMNSLINGTLNTANVLRGTTIRIAITYTTPTFNLLVSNLTGQPYGGYYYNVQQQLAARAGFTIQYVSVPPYPGPPMSYNTWMMKILKYVDLLGDAGYSDTVDRRAAGMGFTRGVIDQSLVMVTTSLHTNQQVDFFSFLSPFSYNLWGYFAGVIFFNGIVHFFVDPFDIPGTTKRTPFYRMFYLSFGTMTNVENLASNTASGNILYTGYGFFIMIMVASYTANLASSLVTNQQNKVTVTSASNANDKSALVCVQAGSNAYTTLSLIYPSIKLVPIYSTSPGDVLAGVSNNLCTAAVIGQSDWNIYSQTTSGNAGCGLYSTGPTIQTIHGAWPYMTDFGCNGGVGCYCTSALEAGLSYYLTNMKADNSLQQQLSASSAQVANTFCPPRRGPPQPSFQLTIFQMGGVFVLYAVGVVAGFLIYLGELIYNKVVLKGEDPNTAACGMSAAAQKAKEAPAEAEGGGEGEEMIE